MPGLFQTNALAGVPNVAKARPAVRSFAEYQFFNTPYAIAGVTKDATGAVLPNAVVQLFRTADDSFVGELTSDSGGNYVIPASNLLAHYLVAYKAGSPDVAGTTRNDLYGSASITAAVSNVIATDAFSGTGAMTADWQTQVTDLPTNIMSRVSDRAINTNICYYYWIGAGTFSNNQYSQFQVDGGFVGAGSIYYASVRASGTTFATLSNYIMYMFGTSYEIHRFVNGTDTSLKTGSMSALVGGDLLRVQVVSNVIAFYKNGILIDSTTDSTHTTGKPGVGGQDTGGQKVHLYNWTGGNT